MESEERPVRPEALPASLPPSGKWTADALHEHFQGQIDRRIETQERERSDLDRHFDQAVQGVRREIETQFRETQRAVTEAGVEREKAAQALASNMKTSIKEGDDRLREHIENQVNQIQAALEATRRETQFANDASQKAIEKAETATEKRFDGVNAFREELAERWERTMPREVAEAQGTEFEKRLDKVERELDKRAGAETAADRRRTATQPWMIWVAGAVLALVIVAMNVIVSGSP